MKQYKSSEYAHALYGLLEKTPAPQQKRIVSWFTSYLMRQNAFSLVPKIIREFSEICNYAGGTIPIEVTTRDGKFHAPELEKAFKSNVRISTRKDSSIRGGIKIKIGDTLIDNTLSRRMDSLRQAISK